MNRKRKEPHQPQHHHQHHPLQHHINNAVQHQTQTPLDPYSLSPDPKRRFFTDPAPSSKLDGAFADVFTRTAIEEESQLTETSIRNGIICAHPLISIDSLSAFDVYKEKLNQDVIGALKRITTSFEANASKVLDSASTFNPPALNALPKAGKTDSWIAILCSKEPLDRLISLIPIPGQSLMDTIGEICKYQPAITRAAWFMKCILLKMAFGKSPQTLFAEAMTKYIQSQVDKLKAPSAATPLNIVGNMKGARPQEVDAFKSPEARNAFILPWLYCVEFVSYCYFEGLLDQRKTLLCVLERFNLKKNSFSQGVIMIPLVWNLLGEFVKSKALTRSILESIIPRTKTLKTIRGESEVISMQYQNLLMMIQYIAISEPDAFVSPMWAVCDSLRSDIFHPSAVTSFKHMPEEARKVLVRDLGRLEADISARVARMKYQVRKGPERPVSINVMNILDTDSLNIKRLSKQWFTIDEGGMINGVSDRILELIQWALLPVDLGGDAEFERRVYLVTCVLLEYINADHSGQLRGRIQVILMDILNDVLTQDTSDFEKVIWLFGDFIRTRVFSLANFVQRLISRGAFELCEAKDRYIRLCLSFPVVESGCHIANIRTELREENNLVYETAAEESIILKAKNILKALLPEIYEDGADNSCVPATETERDLSNFTALTPSMNLFVKSVLSKWIKTGYELYVVKSVAINAENWKKQISSLAPGSSLLTVDQYMALSFFLEEMKDSRSIIELNLWLLSVKAHKKLNACMIDSFLKYKRLLCYMGEASNVAKTFWENKQSFTVTASILDNRFVSFLSSFSAFLPSEYLDAFLHETLQPTSHAKDSITEFNEIRNLKDTEESIFSAVSNLSFRYASSKEMVDRIFKYSLTTLSKISNENSDVFTQKRVQSIVGVLQGVNHQGRFLDKHIGDFLSSSLDLTPGAKLDSFIGEPWMIHFLVQLLLAHCCSVETILMRFLLPVISHQFGTSKPDHVLRFLTVIGVLHTLLVVGEDGDDTGHRFTNLELQALKGVRRSNFDQRELFSALFDIIFKLQTIRDRFESIVSSAKTQDTATINQSLDLVKKTIEFATMTRSWIKVMIEANSTFLREKQVGPWVQSQRELALSSLSGKPQKKSLTPASVARKTGKAFAFLRHVFSRPGDLLFDLSVEQAGLPALIEAMLTDVNESNYQLRKIRLFLMFQEVAIVSQLKVDERLAGGGYEHYLVAVVAEKFVEGMMRSWNYWLYCMIPELPISVLAVILRIGQGHLERSLEAVSFQNLVEEDAKRVEDIVEVCCCAAKVLVDEVVFLGKSARMEAVGGCFNLYKSVLGQLDWFLKKKDDIASVESTAIRTTDADNPVRDFIFLNKLRNSLVSRLRILGALMPFLVNRIDSCSPLLMVETVLMLSVSDLVESSDDSLGDYILDYASYLLETPEGMKHADLKGSNLVQVVSPKLTLRRNLMKRLARIFPIQFDSPYMKNLVSTMDFTNYSPSYPRNTNLIWNPAKHLDPVKWVEGRSYSLKAPEGSLVSEGDGEASVYDIGKRKLNDTPMSLSLFGATVTTQQTGLYQKLLKSGWKQESNVGYSEIKERSTSLFNAIVKHSNKDQM